MKCQKCGSENVNVQMVAETQLANKHHGIIRCNSRCNTELPKRHKNSKNRGTERSTQNC